MKHYVRGAVLLVAAAGLWACGSDPTDVGKSPTKLIADPTTAFVTLGDSTAIVVQAVNDAGTNFTADFEVGTVGAGVVVTRDSLYHGTYDAAGNFVPDPNPTSARYFVKGSAITSTSFTVSASGLSLEIPVRVTPAKDATDLTVDAQTSALGQPLTITAPAGTRFTDSTVITFDLGPGSLIQSFSGDSTQVTVIPGPGSSGHITATHVVALYNTSFTSFTVKSATDTVSVPEVSTFPATPSTTSPTVNVPMTLTGQTGYTFDAGATVTVGGVGAIVTGVSADGTTLTMLPPPGAGGGISVANTIIFGFPLADPLPTGQTLAAIAAPAGLAGTDDPATAPTVTLPAVGEVNAFYEPGTFTGADITGDGGDAAKYYRIDVPVDGTYHISTNWSNGSDIDLVICGDVACGTADFSQATGDQPQGQDYELTAGTYYIAIVLWAGAAPDWATLEITHVSDATP